MALQEAVMQIALTSPTELAKSMVESVQDYTFFVGRAIVNVVRQPRYLADTIQQADSIGCGALPIVVLTGLSMGAELGLNSANTLQRFGALALIGELVSEGMIRELGPIITGLMVAGRSASGMASELGSMVVTEQIDAMRALGVDPMKKLVTPRVVATVFMIFFLTIISDLFGLFGGALISTLLFRMDWHEYWSQATQILDFGDVFMGLVKPLLFGFIISTVGCYYGLTVRGGTQGVGRATTQAVVASSVLILTTDLFVTKFLMAVLW
jgi:phospholipid/cholesterol/gamma-HCH transport system permease protein